MLHLIWYIIVGLIAGWAAKSLMHMHLSLLWTIGLGIVGSIIGGLVTHIFSRPRPGAQFHPAGIIVSILGALLVLWLWHKYKLHIPAGYFRQDLGSALLHCAVALAKEDVPCAARISVPCELLGTYVSTRRNRESQKKQR